MSLLALAMNMAASAILAHWFRPKRYLFLFAATSAVFGGVYVALFFLTPADLFFLPPSWMIANSRLDLVYGMAVFFLNCHTFVDCFFATCGGFSVALLVSMLKRPGKQMTASELVDLFSNRIYEWRVPRLIQGGWLRKKESGELYSLTPKGRAIAVITLTLKRLLNLDKGG